MSPNQEERLAHLLRRFNALKCEMIRHDDEIAGLDQAIDEISSCQLRSIPDDLLQPLLTSCEMARQMLFSEDASCRRAAIIVTFEKWHARDADFCRKIRDMLLHDPSAEVRLAALSCFVEQHNCDDGEAMELLAHIVKGHHNSSEMRVLAYIGMFRLSSRPIADLPLERLASGLFHIEEDVDWSFVNKYVSGRSSHSQ